MSASKIADSGHVALPDYGACGHAFRTIHIDSRWSRRYPLKLCIDTCIYTRYGSRMTATMSHTQEILDIAGLSEVAYPRLDLAPHMDMWDITLPDEETTIRVLDDDGEIVVYLFTGGRAQIESGRMTFRHWLAAPTYVAMMLEQLVADYS